MTTYVVIQHLLLAIGFHLIVLLSSSFTVSKTQAQTQTELLLALLGDKDKSEHLIPASCFYPLLSRVFTHMYSTFLPLFSLQSHNERFQPRTPPLCPCLSGSSLRLNTLLSLSPLFCFKSLHSNAAQQPGEIFLFFFFPLTLLPPPHLGRPRPTGTYLVSVFIPTACLWPTGKQQSVICLQVDRNLPFSSSLAPAHTSKHVICVWIEEGRVR